MASVRLQEDELLVAGFVEKCRDEHVAPYPTSLRVISENTGLTMHEVRQITTMLLRLGVLSKMAAYPDYGVVVPGDAELAKSAAQRSAK
jgi:hypothetical protein